MSRKNTTLLLAEQIAKHLVAEQTRARVMMGFDAAIIAAHEALSLGPGRAAAFAEAYHEAMDWLATLFIDDGQGDKTLEYAKVKRDELIRGIVGDELFVPFERAYGQAYMDELQRIRIMQQEAER